MNRKSYWARAVVVAVIVAAVAGILAFTWRGILARIDPLRASLEHLAAYEGSPPAGLPAPAAGDDQTASQGSKIPSSETVSAPPGQSTPQESPNAVAVLWALIANKERLRQAAEENKRQLKEEQERVDRESVEEAVENFFSEPPFGWIPGTIGPEAIDKTVARYEGEPRIKKLLEIADSGSEEECVKLAALLENLCRVLIGEAASRQEGPPAALAEEVAPLLLARSDRENRYLAVLLRMADHEEAYLQQSLDLSFSEGQQPPISSPKLQLIAYGFQTYLDRYATDVELGRHLTASQVEVIQEYATFRNSRAELDKPFAQGYERELIDLGRRVANGG